MKTALPRPIRYDLAPCRQEFLDILDHINVELNSADLHTALGQLLSQQLRAQGRQIRARLERPFSIVMVGEFKRGKSSLINALLGTPVVTTNVTPETVTINQIQYGEQVRLEAQLADGGWLQLNPEDLAAERLEPLLDNLPHKVHHLRIQAPVEWLQGISLVDTPGTGDIFSRFDSLVHDALAGADIVIFVISALSPLSESERMFLQGSILARDFPKIFFVINRMDAIRTDADADRLRESIQTKLNPIFPKAHLFSVSAEDELCRLHDQPRPNPNRAEALQANFQQLRAAIQDTIQLNQGLIQLDRAIAQLQRWLQTLQAQIVLIRQALQTNQAKLGQAIAQSEDQVSSLSDRINAHQIAMQQTIEQLTEEAGDWLEIFLQRLETEAIARISDYKATDIRRHYHFFLTDVLQRAMSHCLEAHSTIIMEQANQTLQAMASDYQQFTQMALPNLSVASATFQELPWTVLDTLELVAEVSPLRFVSGLLLDQIKDSKVNQASTGYQQQLQQALPAIKIAIKNQTKMTYQNIAKQLIEHIDTAYRQDVDACLESLRQAKSLSEAGGQSAHIIHERLGQLLVLIDEKQEHLKDIQQRLLSSFEE